MNHWDVGRVIMEVSAVAIVMAVCAALLMLAGWGLLELRAALF